ncbi:hypothetical protein RHRU231_940008 [Rhodococcus ruber]|uniref:Uncharacterized protein n=1 Tax=Rhodococcus ruber TaxID=1830 RepID=A0A098BVU1_9NOCA|nr:hypothetical protein RHRU231_940008 [Rhodococcus ruber]
MMPDSAACDRCGLDPCACRYIAELRENGRLAWLREAALAQVNKPLPIGPEGRPTYHRGGCPCPRCWSLCAASWRRSTNPPTSPTIPDASERGNDE